MNAPVVGFVITVDCESDLPLMFGRPTPYSPDLFIVERVFQALKLHGTFPSTDVYSPILDPLSIREEVDA